MDDSASQEYEPLLMQLVLSLQTAAMVEMGKLINPQTGQTERRLPLAKNSIDMLGMLEQKTRGNLTEAERRHLEHVLYELRMNYLDESERPEEPAGEPPSKDEAAVEESRENTTGEDAGRKDQS